MKINEVENKVNSLFEALNQDNDTGVLTEDLVKIVQEEQAGKWEFVSADDFLAELDAEIESDNARN